jgi:SRSO17 transposase
MRNLKPESDISKEKKMKQNKHTTFTGTKTTPADVCRWVQTLFRLHERLAQRFARPEPHRRVLAYLQGILSETSRKNGWQLAEHAGEARPDGMQRLLSNAVWDTDGVRDDLRSYALELLGQECAILVIDESCFRQQRQKIGWCWLAVLRNHWPG